MAAPIGTPPHRGKMTGQLSKPITIYQLAADQRMQPGHHAYLLNGNYPLPTALTFSKAGVSYAPYQNARPVLHPSVANITIAADDVVLTGYEISGTNTNRVSAQVGSNPTDINFYRLLITGKRVELRGCIIHDITELAIDANAHSFTLRDCIVYNCGWHSSAPGERDHGHTFYGQNNGGGALRIINCIFPQSFSYGVHFYGVMANLLGLHVTNLIQFNPRFVIGGESTAPVDDVIVMDSVLWNMNAVLGNSSASAGSLTLTDNYFALSTPIISPAWQSVINTGNVSASGGANVVKVFPSTTEGKVAHIAAMNWEQLDAVSVTVDGMIAGNAYRLRNAYDPLVDVQEFVHQGGDLVLPFVGRTVAKPVGYDTALIALDKRFGAWALEQVA